MSREYKCLSINEFEYKEYSIVPIRDDDKYIIMQMRNDQLFHLRQKELLTKETQEKYFSTTISSIFEEKHPNQVLFSFLKNGLCIGYGGLVHINWVDKYAEISFIIQPELEQQYFEDTWKAFLAMLEKIAFKEIRLHKIFTYAFDLRPHLYQILEKSSFYKEAVLKEHCFFNGKYIDVVIHAKLNSND